MDLLRKIWLYGSREPTQRIGIIVLAVGLISLFSWVINDGFNIEVFYDPYYFPNKRDSFFFHLYLYLIPLGLILSWGYSLLLQVKSWVLREPKKDKFLYFQKRNELTEFIRANWDLKKSNNKPTLGYVSRVLSPDESYKEALELGLINTGDNHVLHVDTLLITKHGEELVFTPCDALGANLEIGDFVLLAQYGGEERQDWHYVLIAKLKPIYNSTKKGWVIDCDYRIK